MRTMAVLDRFDPWGPISTIVYETNNSDFVQDAVGNTGIPVPWRPLTKEQSYSHSTRIRAYREAINTAYSSLNSDQRGIFAQIILKALLRRFDAHAYREKLVERLNDIGWVIADDGTLRTDDALVSEHFFPPNSEYDAYVMIRDVLDTARSDILIIDPYLGSSLLLTLRGLSPRALSVNSLTSDRNLRADFRTELEAFRQQMSHVRTEVRTATSFHDRFLVIDGNDFYHVGASIEDAGKRAFMIRIIAPRVAPARDRHSQLALITVAAVRIRLVWGFSSNRRSRRRETAVLTPDVGLRATGSDGGIPERDRRFESVSLQRRVECEPDLAPWNRSPRPVPWPVFRRHALDPADVW
jgi:hypothetical protein